MRRARQDRRPYQTFSWIAGAALMLSGIFHFGIFLIDGGSWQGPVSWRKPVTFGLSFGLTTVTLAWLAGMLRKNIMWLASAGYTGLILAVLLQTFEGRAPADLTPLAIGVLPASALLGTVAIVGLAAGLFGSKPQHPAA